MPRLYEPLLFSALREVNLRRCIDGFKHKLESWSVLEWAGAMCGEAGEAANIAKKMIRHRDGVAGNKGEDLDLDKLRKKLAKELADAVIYADLVAASQGIDLGQAVRETFNEKSRELELTDDYYLHLPMAFGGAPAAVLPSLLPPTKDALVQDHDFVACSNGMNCMDGKPQLCHRWVKAVEGSANQTLMGTVGLRLSSTLKHCGRTREEHRA
jgi:NTP pyrophosphatase (non-canonical NTP hydrolase)